MIHSSFSHLPITQEECLSRGWDAVDIVMVTGDAYVDHPSFGIALLARLLEHEGYRVAILSQPRYDSCNDFKRFGRPRLFFAISGGNLDSIVANYSAHGKVRDFDAYSRDGNPWRSQEQSKTNRRRPDRATLIYAQLAREAYGDVPLILGGIEASLRRFIHYDYKQAKLRGSVLTDSKSDLLIYGMGEKAICSIAAHLQDGLPLEAATAFTGCCRRMTDAQFKEFSAELSSDELLVLPSWEEIQKNPRTFLEAELQLDKHAKSCSQQIVIQKQQSAYVVQFPPAAPLQEKELDALYALPFCRTTHPQEGEIPAYRMICHSVTIVRGCSGNCSFCAITRHQGPIITSRSIESIVEEVKQISRMPDFKGTISDLGGPTANLYGTSCTNRDCKRHDCLYPTVCKNLHCDETRFLTLLEKVLAVPGVRHVFISSGLRMELLLKTPKLLRQLLLVHLPGAMKIAPEHTEKGQLELMHKESHQVLRTFLEECRRVAKNLKKQVLFTPYIITGHPGSSEQDTRQLIKKMQDLGLQIRQFQDFTPTPGTISTAMYVAGCDRKGLPIYLPSPADLHRQRALIEKTFLKKKNDRRKK